jgi:hypothetical protein
MLRTFSVFHASQTDGMPELTPAVATKAVAERIEDVEIIVRASGVPVRSCVCQELSRKLWRVSDLAAMMANGNDLIRSPPIPV